MPIEYSTTQYTIRSLVEWRRKGKLMVPKHQRGYVWDLKRREGLIDTISRGLPIPSLTLSHVDLSGNKYYIEDGQQRIETMVRYTKDDFSVEGIFFSALGEDGQECFLNYKVPVLIYTGATPEERIEIFDRLQNGMALSSGERFHALRFLSPLIQYTCETLLYENAELHELCEPIWGLRLLVDDGDNRGDKTKRYRNLSEAVCMISGTLWGPSFYSNTYEYLREKLRYPLSLQQKERSLNLLKTIMCIYKKALDVELDAGEDKLSLKKLRDSFWNPKNFTGYILFSLWENEGKWPEITKKWIEFLIQYRKRPQLLKEKLLDVSSGLTQLEVKYRAGWNSINNRFTGERYVRQEEEEEEEDD